MNPFTQYLKDTRAELRHVAWPTQAQTIVYTILVALISIGIALYLGLFDYIFTTGLARVINAKEGTAPSAIEISTSTPVLPELSTSTIPKAN